MVHTLVINKRNAEQDSGDDGQAPTSDEHDHGHHHEPEQMEAALETEEAPAGAVVENKSDDLSLMKGVGPKLAESMNEIGIHNYNQLAKINADELYERLQEVGARVVNKPSLSTLAGQAKLAAKGDWDGLEALQKSL